MKENNNMKYYNKIRGQTQILWKIKRWAFISKLIEVLINNLLNLLLK